MRCKEISALTIFCASLAMTGCSPLQELNHSARDLLVEPAGLNQAHIGICIFEEGTGKFLYNYQGEKYFVPASNTKLFSLYTALKYLGDSLPGMRYAERGDTIFLQPTGDPSLLHADFSRHPVAEWLKKSTRELVINGDNWHTNVWGYGWAWDDYNSDFMAEKSGLPVYGNLIKWIQVTDRKENEEGKWVEDAFVYSEPEVPWKLKFNAEKGDKFSVIRDRDNNVFRVTEGRELLRSVDVPFVTNGLLSALDLLRDTLGKSITLVPAGNFPKPDKIIYSQSRDTLLSRMMHRSDNFYAEQSLLMVSQQLIGSMDTEKLIDTLLKTDFRELPQAPHWVDGSGLSRYNLFSPQDFVWLLQKMEQEFGRERLQKILSGANEGTLAGYYKAMPGAIFAKTGTLSGQVALSGYLTSKKGKRFIFSVLVNNHTMSASKVRRAVEAFLTRLYQLY